MKKLTIKLLGTYRNQKGNTVFRYALTGSADALAAYKEVQGTFYRENPDGTVLWFSPRFVGKAGELIVNTETKKCYADMSAFDAAASLAEQYGGNFGQSLAATMAGDLLGVSPAPQQSVAPQAETEEVEEGNGDLEQH